MDLIASNYVNSDSEDEADPWSAAGVSTKRSLNEQSLQPQKKSATSSNNNTRLPVPFALRQSLVSEEHSDEPLLHDNRIRTFPHERGNWATFIHLPWTTSSELSREIETVFHWCNQKGVDLNICEDFHVSLTKTVVLRHHWIEGFTTSVKKTIENLISTALYFQDFGVYLNEDKTRSFLAFNVHDSSQNLNLIVQYLDKIMEEYQLPIFYENPSHHVSFGWCIGDRKQEIENIMSSYSSSFFTMEQSCCQPSEVICKVGNMKFVCPLKS